MYMRTDDEGRMLFEVIRPKTRISYSSIYFYDAHKHFIDFDNF